MKPTIELASLNFNPSQAYPEDLTEWITKKSIQIIHAAANKFKEMNLNEDDYLINFMAVTEKWNITVTAVAFDASDLESRLGTTMTYSEAQNY